MNEKKILINTAQKEELRVAVVGENSTLFDLTIETRGKEQKKANIYKGVITRIEPSLEAAFVSYGGERHGFLPFKEISKEYINSPTPEDITRQNIKDFLFEGQELIIQVEKEERGNKGAAITTFISLAGSYLVLMPNNPQAGGISRKIEGEERENLKKVFEKINVPNGMGVIVRTSGLNRSEEELAWDLDVLTHQWQTILDAANNKSAPFLIYEESNAAIRTLRDHLKPDITEIIIDDKAAYHDIIEYIRMIRPDYADRVKLYQHKTSLFSRYKIEDQIATAFQREAHLPSGGTIVIDQTEALISIDINSARSTKGHDIEATAFQTNLEAAREIARQLRLRDMGGLIVIDFIDMQANQNQRDVENCLKDALSLDRAKIQIGKISRFGLLEMSRQRLRPTLAETNQITCPRCQGHGKIHSMDNMGATIERAIVNEAMHPNIAIVQAILPIDLATHLMNEKRDNIKKLETQYKVKIILTPNPNLKTPEFTIEKIKHSEVNKSKQSKQSHTLIPKKTHAKPLPKTNVIQEPAVKRSLPNTPAPKARPPQPKAAPKTPQHKKPTHAHKKQPYKRPEKTEKPKSGLLKKIWFSLIGEEEKTPEATGHKPRHHHNKHRRKHYHRKPKHDNKGGSDRNRSHSHHPHKPKNKQDDGKDEINVNLQ